MSIINEHLNNFDLEKKYSLCIYGEPTAKARPRYTGKFVYTPVATKNYEVLVKELFISKYGSVMLDGAVQAVITAYFSIAKSTSKKNRQKMINKGATRITA